MIYIKSRNSYEASNFIFEIDTKKAWSYGWWNFSRVVNDKLIFNNTTYSMTTCRHQHKAWRLLNYKADLTLNYTTVNLTDISEALKDEIKNCKYEIDTLKKLIKKKGTRKSKNAERIDEIGKLLTHIKKVKSFLKEEVA